MLLYARLKYAGMVELADTQDLGSCGRPCRFKSCYPHQKELFQTKQLFFGAEAPTEPTGETVGATCCTRRDYEKMAWTSCPSHFWRFLSHFLKVYQLILYLIISSSELLQGYQIFRQVFS